jgi:hypothetical protein
MEEGHLRTRFNYAPVGWVPKVKAKKSLLPTITSPNRYPVVTFRCAQCGLLESVAKDKAW